MATQRFALWVSSGVNKTELKTKIQFYFTPEEAQREKQCVAIVLQIQFEEEGQTFNDEYPQKSAESSN